MYVSKFFLSYCFFYIPYKEINWNFSALDLLFHNIYFFKRIGISTLPWVNFVGYFFWAVLSHCVYCQLQLEFIHITTYCQNETFIHELQWKIIIFAFKTNHFSILKRLYQKKFACVFLVHNQKDIWYFFVINFLSDLCSYL